MKNRKIILIKRPSTEIDSSLFKLVEEDIPTPGSAEVLVKSKYFSVDPYMRNRMNDVKSYIEPYALNESLSGDAIAEIIESNDNALQKGDLVTGILGWQDYQLVKAKQVKKIEAEPDYLTAHLGVLGLTGFTAYFGMLDIGEPKSGETVVVSGAAGAVGSISGQIAKMKGCRVIGIAGSEQKADYIKKELDFDEAINYKQFSNVRKPLRRACPDGIDVYFDNVGGEISDNVLYMINDYARIVLCGQISLYNTNRLSMGPRLLAQLIIHRAKMQGFIVYDYIDQFDRAYEQILEWLKGGKLKHHENIIEGFENLPNALIGLFQGDNIGKQLVQV